MSETWTPGAQQSIFLLLLTFLTGCGGGPAASDAAGGDDGGAHDAASIAPDLALPDGAEALLPLRYLSANVGNTDLIVCWETKLCKEEVAAKLRAYITAWQPDVVLLSEVQRAEQLKLAGSGGPLLPPGYDGLCGESRDRDSDELVAWNAERASHEHECVAWKQARVSYVPGSARSARGRNDDYGKGQCEYHFTSLRVDLVLEGSFALTAVTVHPDASILSSDCRTEEIQRTWSELADAPHVIIGGDWNSDSAEEIAVPPSFRINYERGQHWDLAFHYDEYSAFYTLGIKRQLDDAYSNFGWPCVNCGAFYGSDDLPFSSALGGYDDHPQDDEGEGCDHAQILVDMWVSAGGS